MDTDPDLNVYGASARGQMGKGIGNIELAYYQSADDESGSNLLVNNSEMRYLVGYTQDLAKDFNASLQYYIEQIMDYHEYKESLRRSGPGSPQACHNAAINETVNESDIYTAVRYSF